MLASEKQRRVAAVMQRLREPADESKATNAKGRQAAHPASVLMISRSYLQNTSVAAIRMRNPGLIFSGPQRDVGSEGGGQEQGTKRSAVVPMPPSRSKLKRNRQMVP